MDRQVLCYAPAGPAEGWLFAGCHAEQVSRYDIGHGRYTADRDADPLVRSVWVSGPDFEAGFILTLSGKTLRWGPGWWTQHPGDGWPGHTKAIAAKLRDISAADPSQALRSHSTQQDHRPLRQAPGGQDTLNRPMRPRGHCGVHADAARRSSRSDVDEKPGGTYRMRAHAE